MKRRLINILLALILTALCRAVYSAPSPYADTVIINASGLIQAVAIRDDDIIAVGTNAEIRKYVADWTEVVNANQSGLEIHLKSYFDKKCSEDGRFTSSGSGTSCSTAQCVLEYRCAFVPPQTQSMPKSTTSLDDAKTKCADLGFTESTEKFGECVLKLSK